MLTILGLIMSNESSLQEVRAKFPGNDEKIRNMSIIEESGTYSNSFSPPYLLILYHLLTFDFFLTS